MVCAILGEGEVLWDGGGVSVVVCTRGGKDGDGEVNSFALEGTKDKLLSSPTSAFVPFPLCLPEDCPLSMLGVEQAVLECEKVPKSLWNERLEAYVPRVVSLGPFHHLKSEFSNSKNYKKGLIINNVHQRNINTCRLFKEMVKELSFVEEKNEEKLQPTH
eukprot:Gb_01441 [translate_table: standard]